MSLIDWDQFMSVSAEALLNLPIRLTGRAIEVQCRRAETIKTNRKMTTNRLLVGTANYSGTRPAANLFGRTGGYWHLLRRMSFEVGGAPLMLKAASLDMKECCSCPL
ncbi:hypothetical protein J6590_012320 [Homalodisca vitripennis]|nr:hypothetical protein J6590_012320 [Homalodisca vitripennis]